MAGGVEQPTLADDERFRTVRARVQPRNEEALRQEIEAWSSHHTSDEILDRILADPGPGVVVFGRVETPTEVLARQNWWERDCFQRVSDPIYGELTLQMPVWRMTETPPRLRWACRPTGYHNGHIHQKYPGLGPGYLAELEEQGVL